MSDLINRAEALNAINVGKTLEEAFRNVTALPSAQPKRKTGEWIEKEVIHEVEASTAIDEWQSAKCSVCGKYHTTPYLYYFDDFNYCPNCGADLRGDTE